MYKVFEISKFRCWLVSKPRPCRFSCECVIRVPSAPGWCCSQGSFPRKGMVLWTRVWPQWHCLSPVELRTTPLQNTVGTHLSFREPEICFDLPLTTSVDHRPKTSLGEGSVAFYGRRTHPRKLEALPTCFQLLVESLKPLEFFAYLEHFLSLLIGCLLLLSCGIPLVNSPRC